MEADVNAYFLAQLEKLRCLRQTARGEVWLALLPEGRLVVWKRIRATGLPYALLASRPPHPLWPEILYCTEDETETVVVEDYVQGEPLSARLAEHRPLAENEAATLLLQIADGLAILHGLGVVHRDIKPSNLILSANGVRLIDFDAARTVKEEKTEDTALLGTKGYAPPEQFGYGQTDARSDLYALGVTFRALLGADYHGWLSPILAKCAEIDPNRRYASAAELKRAILMRRRWAKAKTGCFAVLAILVGAALYFLPAPTKNPKPTPEEPTAIPTENVTPTPKEEPAAPAAVPEPPKQEENDEEETTPQETEVPAAPQETETRQVQNEPPATLTPDEEA
ncbi:MAG: serine/threonine protein kinase, partial [Schwartzia sp.]|nr:serine/threonine protein kinase [Schwartzia sp. (in: firmicutes)]